MSKRKLTEKRKKLLIELEAIIGNHCYNANIQNWGPNGVFEGAGREFRYPNRARHLPDHIVLLHRSQECNCPELVRKMFSVDRRIAPRLTLAQQCERSPWLGRLARNPCAGEQLMLAL